MQTDLELNDGFGFELPSIDWLPDESFYSLCSRLHRLFGHAQPAATARLLFGHSRRGSQPAFPTRLAQFISRTRGAFGTSVERILRSHSIAAFYFPWRTLRSRTLAVQACASGNLRALRAELAAPQTDDKIPLRYCQQCAANDRSSSGVAYWHLCHQFPGVWICIHHNLALTYIEPRYLQGLSVFNQWHLPLDFARLGTIPLRSYAPQLSNRLERQAHIATRVAKLHDDFRIDYVKLHQTYMDAIAAKGWKSVEDSYEARQFRQHWITGNARGEVDEARNGRSSHLKFDHRLTKALFRPELDTDPVFHIMLIAWLFKDWNEFAVAYGSSCCNDPYQNDGIGAARSAIGLAKT